MSRGRAQATESALRPDRSRTALLLQNALANLLRAASSSAVTVLLPLCLVIVFHPDVYAAWALVFSLATFVLYFDLGVPTSVQAIVGRAIGTEDFAAARRVTVAGIKIIGAVSAVALAAAIGAGLMVGDLFPDMPFSLRDGAGIALVLIVLGQASSLVGNTVSAYFAGQQRSFVPTLILAPARLVSMIASLAAAILSDDLVWSAFWYAAPVLLGTLLLCARFIHESVRTSRRMPAHPAVASRPSEVRTLLQYSGPLMLWGVCMLITTGAGVILVARLDYQAVVSFSVAAIIVSALAGLESSATAPLLPELARTHELHGSSRVSTLLLKLSAYNGTFLLLVTATLLALGPWLLPLLLKGDGDVAAAWLILAVLLIGNAIHLTGTPLSLAFIATKTHTRVIYPPVIEAIINLGVSVWLGLTYGAVGVALGALIAGIVGVVLGFWWSTKLSNALMVSPRKMFMVSTFRPLISVTPVIVAVSLVLTSGGQSSWWGVTVCILSLIVSGMLLWLFSLPTELRRELRQRVMARNKKHLR